MKKKTTVSKAKHAASEPAKADATLLLKIDRAFQLLGYYDPTVGAGTGGCALVRLEPAGNDPAQFATYEVKSTRSGLCVLPHYYGTDQWEQARADFLSRSQLDVLFARRR